MEQEPLEKETADKLKSRINQWQGYIEQSQKTVKFAQPEQASGKTVPSIAVVRPASRPSEANAGPPGAGQEAPAVPNRVLGGYEAQKAARQAPEAPEREVSREPAEREVSWEPAEIIANDPFEADSRPWPDMDRDVDTRPAGRAGGYRMIDVLLVLGGVALLFIIIYEIVFRGGR